MSISYLFLLLLAITTYQHTPLLLAVPTQVTLSASKSEMYSLDIPATIQPHQDLIITTIPLLDIPSQIPHLTLQSANRSYQCYRAGNQLEGVCTISYQDLMNEVSQTIELNLTCPEACSFVLDAYLNDAVILQLAQKYQLIPDSDSNSIYEFYLQVPDQPFDQITIEAGFKLEMEAVDRGVTMYANVGNSGGLMPNELHFQYKGIQIEGGIGISIGKADLPKGTWIKLAVFSNKNIEIGLTAQLKLDSTEQLALNKYKSCFLAGGVQENFVLNLTSMSSILEEKDLFINAFVYSGNPEIKLSFNALFTKTLQNYGLGGSLTSLLTPTIRSLNNYSGLVYIRLLSKTEAYLTLSSSINPKEYVYMSEAITYLSFIPPKNIENYIFDYYYQLQSGETGEKMMHFTAKMKVVAGAGFFFSRICNQFTIAECLLSKESQLDDKEFMREVEDLPSSILIYNSLYELYIYTPINKCRIVQKKANTTEYLCRLHMVGYNFNQGQLQWGLTTYSRQRNIELSEGKTFKDMVYEDSYNFYSFTVPPNTTELTVFLTALSGEAALVTSQVYINPQIPFVYLMGSDVKTNVNNIIRYEQSQLKGKVYIGVYGRSMTEYIVNVAIKRRSNKNTVLELIPEIQQFFHSDAESLSFSLSFSSVGWWVVEVVQLEGSINATLQRSGSSSLECQSFSKCVINATSKGQALVTVRSQGYAKFAISYYPKDSCRLLSIGTVHFIEIQPNTTQCVEFFIAKQSLQISYSEKLIKSFSSNPTISVAVNDNNLGVMQSHYLAISKEESSLYCKTNITSQKCLLSLKIAGDSQTKIELQLSVIDFTTPVPLLDGVALPFSISNLKKETGIYFYYYSLSNNTPTLLVRSLTLQSFILCFKWIDYSAYSNNTSFPSIVKQADFKTSFQIDQYSRLVKIKVPLPVNTTCEECLLLVAIFAIDNYRETIFQLQISSQQQMVEMGETIRTNLNKDELYSYSLQKPDPKEKAVVSLYNDKTGQGCYQAILTSSQSPYPILFQGNEILISSQKQHKLTIRSFQDNCKIEFVYWRADVPLRIIYPGLRYSLSLDNSTSAYLLYFHQVKDSFHLFMSARSGYVSCEATPIINQSLQAIIKENHFIFKSNSIYQDIEISPKHGSFCMNCYYLIKVTGEPSARGAMGVADSLTAVELMGGEVLREKVKSGLRYYECYGLSEFTVKLGVVYGSLLLEVTDPMKNLLFSEVLRTDRDVSFKRNISSGYFDRFVFKIVVNSSATYSLQIIEDSKVRLVEGYPLIHRFKPTEAATFVYSHASVSSFTLFFITDQALPTQASLSVEIIGNDANGEKMLSNKTNSWIGNIHLYEIAGEYLDYHFTVRLACNQSISMKLLVARDNLTFLQEGSPSIGRSNAIYQIFTEGSPIMMEIYACKGDLHVTASSRYSQIRQSTSTNAIALQHSNIGGHYVIESSSAEPEYFAWVSSHSSIYYTISYTNIKTLPYKYFSTIQRSIEYKVGLSYLEMGFEVPAQKEKSLENAKGKFVMLVANNTNDLTSLTQCGFGTSLFTTSDTIPEIGVDQSQIYKFNISKKQLENIMSQEIQTYFIGIILTISFKEDNQQREVKYIYEALQLSLLFPTSNEPAQSSIISYILVWVVLPTLAGIAIAVYSLRYCLHRFRAFTQPPNELMQEEISSAPALQDKQRSDIQSDEPKTNS